MKNWNFRSFAFGVLATVFCSSLIGTASASVGQRTMLADYQDIRITLDGVELTPTDANGNVVEPFSVDGTTYLPVRAIGNALGLGVEWDGATGTVALSTPSQDPAPESSLPSLPPLQTTAPEDPGSDDWFGSLSDNEKHDVTFAFLRSWIQTAQNDTVGGCVAYTEKVDNFSYSLAYDSSSDQIALVESQVFDGGHAISSLWLTDSSLLWPTDSGNSYFGRYQYYYALGDKDPVVQIDCFVPVSSFSWDSGYTLVTYTGDKDLQASHEKLSNILFSDSLDFLGGLFDTKISKYGPYSLSDFGLKNF